MDRPRSDVLKGVSDSLVVVDRALYEDQPKVTLQAERVKADERSAFFDAFLVEQGLVKERFGEGIIFVTTPERRVRIRAAMGDGSAELVTRELKARHELIDVLEPLLTPRGSVAFDESRFIVFITDVADAPAMMAHVDELPPNYNMEDEIRALQAEEAERNRPIDPQ